MRCDVRSAMFFTYCILTTSCVLLDGSLASPKDCQDFTQQNYISLQNCTIRRSINDKEWASCATLENMAITKLRSREPHLIDEGTAISVPLCMLVQLLGLEEFHIEISFSGDNPNTRIQKDVRMSKATANIFSTESILPAQVKKHCDVWEVFQTAVLRQPRGTIRVLDLTQSSTLGFNVNSVVHKIGTSELEAMKINGAALLYLKKEILTDEPMLFLKSLDLSNSQLNLIEYDFFEASPNLTHLTLANNNLVTLPPSLAILQHLEDLDLSLNPFIQIMNSSWIFHNLVNLRRLNLSHTPVLSLQYLKPLISRGKNNRLWVLDVSNSGIKLTEEDSEIFDSLPYLLELNMSGNGLSTIPVDLFRSLIYIRSIVLSFNMISKLHKLNIQETMFLEFLDLSNNKINDLRNISIKGTVNEINLSGNSISSWEDSTIFQNCEQKIWVKHLNLSYNSVKYISESMTQSLEQLESVDLGGNPFDCDHCSTPILQHWLLSEKSAKILNLGSVGNLSCGGFRNEDIVNVNFNTMECLVETETDPDYALAIGLPLLVVISLVLLIVIAIYGYRFEIAYVRHLINIRRQREIRDKVPTSRYKYDAFVSYSAADRDWVTKELQPQLENGPEKYRLCLHERDFVLGSIIAENIVECMRDSRNTLVVLTPHFVRSQWCRWELEVANHKLFEDDREFLILIELKKLDKKTLPRHLVYLVDTRTYLEWPKSSGPHPRAWIRLKHALGDSLYQRRMRERAKDKNERTDSEECTV